MCVRRHLTINSMNKMDDTCKAKLADLVLNDDDVLFNWCLAGQMEGDEAADICLAMVVKMWITIRAFSLLQTSLSCTNRNQRKELKRPNHYAALC